MDYPQVSDKLIFDIWNESCSSDWVWDYQSPFLDSYDTSIYVSSPSSIYLGYPSDTDVQSIVMSIKTSPTFEVLKVDEATYYMNWWHRDTQVGGNNWWQKHVYFNNSTTNVRLSGIALSNDAANTWIQHNTLDITSYIKTGDNWIRCQLMMRYGGPQSDYPADVWWDDFHIWAEIPG